MWGGFEDYSLDVLADPLARQILVEFPAAKLILEIIE